jgi:NAD dependent epimerase/dehydratase family enzyme
MQIGPYWCTGFVGRAVVKNAIRRGHEVVAFTRNPGRIVHDCIETRSFSLKESPDFRGCEAVIHLAAGENVADGVATEDGADSIQRVEGTRRVVRSDRRSAGQQEVLVCASGSGYYGDGGETELTETAPAGDGFLSEVCRLGS